MMMKIDKRKYENSDDLYDLIMLGLLKAYEKEIMFDYNGLCAFRDHVNKIGLKNPVEIINEACLAGFREGLNRAMEILERHKRDFRKV